MLIQMSKQEIEAWEKRVSELRESTDPIKRIMAILMDSSIGRSGLHESTAQAKAEEIFRQFLSPP